ncbi:sialidase family protein [uncultured Legionella sp.]|uniref:sialidase family protein n=1 Tax=uncultured Legionella sp. TaxID=210934 RepID=UPI002624FA29|nr:sialidase family protein [uncultured Legionella sp.]
MEKMIPTLKQLVLLFALPLLLGFSSIQSQQPLPLIATGYFFDGNIRRPLLIQSDSLGDTWQYPASIHQAPLPADFVDGGLGRSSCNNFVCIATGNYLNTGESSVPLLMQSSDRGLKWSLQDIKHRPTDFQTGQFNDSICTDTRCIAVGMYANSNGSRPLLAVSDSKGNWHYSMIPDNSLPTDFKEGWFNTVRCSNIGCLAAGTYLDTQTQRHPLIMTSKDDGLSWNTAVYNDELIDLAGNSDSYLFASSCDSSLCVAVGEYTNPQNTVAPLLLHSTNAGKNWDKPSFPLPSDFESGWFRAVDCKAGFCIAVGSYNNGEITIPMLVSSADGGKHWQLQKPVQDSELGTHLEYGSYESASCNETGCIAGGSFSNYFNTYPLITISHDKGQSWHSPSSARTSVPEAELGNGSFGTVKCQQNICIAAGDYTIDTVYYPLLALSNDSGMTWSFPESINNPDILPSNFINGYFYSDKGM